MFKERKSKKGEAANAVKEVMQAHTDGILEYVSDQKVAWRKLARVMSKIWDEKGGKLLFKDKSILPVTATKNSDYLYINLDTGELVDLNGSCFLKPSQAKIFEFTDSLDALNATKLLQLFTKLNEQKRSWEGVDTYDDLVKWLLIVRVAQYAPVDSDVAFSVYKASIQKIFDLNEGSLNDVLGKVWELIHDGVLNMNPERRLILNSGLKITS